MTEPTVTPSPTLDVLPVLPVKNTVLYPNLFMPLAVGRPGSVAAVEAAMQSEEKTLIVVTQRDASVETPGFSDLYGVGTRAVVRKMARSGGNIELLVQGVERVVLERVVTSDPYLKVQVRILPWPQDSGTEIEALERAVLEAGAKVIELVQPQATVNLSQLSAHGTDPLQITYLVASMLNLDTEKLQNLLEARTRGQALKLVHEYLQHEIDVLELRQKIASEAATEMSKEQREYMLRQQMRAIQAELGEKDPDKADIEILKQRLVEADLPEEALKEVKREMERLERIPAASPDHQLTRSYVELVLELPWKKSTTEEIDVARARQVLDEDHYDLVEVKSRILEHLAVLKMNPQAHAPILCLVGAPGVGKTSVGQSIARSLGRKFERMSLGGMHDEAELRGHRRTYIGAMPGRIIQAMRRAGVNNPVLMLDEVDKLGRDFRGDPASALLEVLDPAQNVAFHDNYLNLPFDISKVFFITTANTLDSIPAPLLDRMEILRLAGYSEEEKVEIAKRYLIPRQRTQSGLSEEQFQIPDATLARIIRHWSREAGVRKLEQAIGRVARKVALHFAEGKTEPVIITEQVLSDMLGPERYSPERARKDLPAGVATGLAWTEAGGEVLYIEAMRLPEGRKLRLTGQLGAVMRESAKAAQSYVWAHAEELGIDPRLFRDSSVHIHVPAGAVPKDGPSAGVAMITALASLYTGRPARSDTAMTGEITLTGLVLPIGGVKEKVLAARRAGMTRVILPRDNEKDMRELPDDVRKELSFTFVETVDEVLAASLTASVGELQARAR